MILNVTYVYEADVVPKQKRNAVTREFVATVPVEIEELSSADLPVAIRFEDRKSYSQHKGMVWDVRWSPERGHWQPDVEIEEAPEGEGPSPIVHYRDADWLSAHANALDPAVRGYHSDPLGLLANSSARGLLTIEATPGIKTVKKSNQKDREMQVREKAAGMVLVDGVLHERAKEPVYKVSEPSGFGRRGERERYLYVERMNDGIDATHAAGSLYRADEREMMLSRHRFGDDVGESMIEVIIPEAVRAPLPEMALVDAGKKLMDNLKEKIHEGDRAFFSTYADVRDTLTAYRIALANTNTNAALPPEGGNLSAVLQEALVVAKAAQPDYYGWMHDRVQAACDRYDARALGFEMDAASPAP